MCRDPLVTYINFSDNLLDNKVYDGGHSEETFRLNHTVSSQIGH